MAPNEVSAAPVVTVPTARPATVSLGWIAVMVALAGLNLRPLLTSLGVSLEAVRLDLGLSSTAAGLLAAVPTFCMGAVALVGGWLIARLGSGLGLRVAMLLVAAGCVGRWLGFNPTVMFAATLVGGLGIACGQVLIPVVIKQYFPGRAALMMGLFTTAMNLGAAVGAAATPALMAVGHGDWRLALGIWALPALVAALLWPVRLARPRGDNAWALPWADARAWRMAFFLGSGSIAYMSLLAWLVPFYVAQGHSQAQGAALLTVFTGAQIAAALLVPPLAGLWRDRRPAIAISLILLMVGVTGLWWAPASGGVPWAVIAGIGLGGSFPLALTLPLDYAATPTEAGRLSALVQGLAMLMGALGPLLFGALRDGFGFPAAMLFLLSSVVVSFLLGLTFPPPPLDPLEEDAR